MGVLGELTQVARRGEQLVVDGDQPGQRDAMASSPSVAAGSASRSDRSQRELSVAIASMPCAGALEPAGVELGLADDVDQLVDLGGRDPHRVAAAAQRVVDAVVLVDDRAESSCGTTTGSSPASARCIASASACRCSSGTGSSTPGSAPAMPSQDGEQQVDEVAADRQPAVAKRAEQVLGVVRDREDLGQAEHPGRALDGVGVAEQARDDLARRGMRLEREQPSLQRRDPLLDLGAERREQLRVVSPAGHRSGP